MDETTTASETSRRTAAPFRADHVGSLLRPAQLLQAREDFASGAIGAGDLRAIEDDAIRDVVRKQEDVGLSAVTDGEFRRASWHMDFIYQLGGITKAPGNLSVKFHNADGDIEFTPAAMHIDGKVTLEKPIFARDFEFLKPVRSEGVEPARILLLPVKEDRVHVLLNLGRHALVFFGLFDGLLGGRLRLRVVSRGGRHRRRLLRRVRARREKRE